jgi:hypothetical protein
LTQSPAGGSVNRRYLVRKAVFRVARLFRGFQTRSSKTGWLQFADYCVLPCHPPYFAGILESDYHSRPKFNRRLPRRSLGEGGFDVSPLFSNPHLSLVIHHRFIGWCSPSTRAKKPGPSTSRFAFLVALVLKRESSS